jgi:Cyclic GMP-AMP synthase DncV-like, nucleotidyltransferase domain
MNNMRLDGFDPFLRPLDAILVDIAINVQLPPGLHSQATNRYEAVRRHIERKGSPLENLVTRFYPQGSMAIGATTSTRGTDDEYDLDIVAELGIDCTTPPGEVLDLLHQALREYPVQRVERQTRCVTLRYADRMHLDITPSARLPNSSERESHIFHAKGQNPAEHSHVSMNAWGFALFYQGRTPLERRFAKAFNRRLYEAHGYAFKAEADVDDVPDQVPLIVKNTATVALQLLKRFRNVAYDGCAGRIPPSVLMSAYAAQSAQPNIGLSEMVIRQAQAMASAIRQASARREKLLVQNPVFKRDVFTDRWPESIQQQNEFGAKLTDLADGLEAFRRGDHELEEVQAWLRMHFGDRVVSASIKRFNERAGRAVQQARQSYTRSGGLYVPSAPAIVGTTVPAAARAHTFMGERRR